MYNVTKQIKMRISFLPILNLIFCLRVFPEIKLMTSFGGLVVVMYLFVILRGGKIRPLVLGHVWVAAHV